MAPQKSFEYNQNPMIQGVNQNFGIYMIIALLFPCINFIQRALEEKSSKTRESMRMMGMLDSSYHVSWFVFFVLNVLFVSVEITIISLFIFTYSNFLLVFLFYFFYGVSLFGYMMIFIAVFKEVKTGTPIFTIIHLILYYLRWAIPDSAPLYVRVLTSFIPNLAANNFALVIWNLEE
jgi:ATP-binding cassette, subfamily A (ABC1), member 3